jgi:enamine deaminase RidA (YjgF/YER057c/UK114 family)
MTVHAFNPPGLPTPDAYRQIAIATGSRMVYLSGQVARTASGERVGEGDLVAQTEQAYLNVATALAAVGASFDNVARLNLYVLDWAPHKWQDIQEGARRAAHRLQADLARPMTLIGAAALAEPDLLVEVEATAVLP